MGRDMDQNHGKHAKGHLLHLRIFIKAPQAAAQQPNAGASIKGGGNCPPDFVFCKNRSRRQAAAARRRAALLLAPPPPVLGSYLRPCKVLETRPVCCVLYWVES